MSLSDVQIQVLLPFSSSFLTPIFLFCLLLRCMLGGNFSLNAFINFYLFSEFYENF